MAATAEPTEAAAKPGLLGRPLVLVGLLAAAMAAEFVVLYMVLPAPAPAAEHADEAEHDHGDELSEVSVDAFSTTNTRAVPGGVVHVTFKLTALVPTAQVTAFEHAANEQNNARVRQAVLKVCRATTLDDLNDPSWLTLRRQLREEVNKVLRHSYVIDMVISDFKTMEQ